MCGILGVIKKDEKINFDNFKNVNKIQKHRGPDDEGFWISKNKQIAIGNNRLSIIDLKQGHQPIINTEKKLAIVYNGEIYNYLELKKDLISKGYNFITSSDTEVILAAYSEWGEGCVNYFRGMFAFAIVDEARSEIFLSRDNVGIKPLVYYTDDKIFCFASEIKTLTNIANLNLDLDYNAIDLFLWLQYIPAPKTVFTKIKKLEPGNFMIVGFDGEIKSHQRYWRPVFKPNVYKSADDWAEDFEKTISESVKLHTVSDVGYGAFLSGGLDSSLIVKYLTEINQSQIKTFSIGFNEAEFSELEYAKIASGKFNTDHYSKIITAQDYLSIFEKLVAQFGEPFGDSSAIPTYFVSKLASEHVKVVLSGDGGDELFGGYNSYLVWQELMKKKKNRPRHLNFIRFWLSIISPRRFVPEKPNLAAWLNIISYYKYNHRLPLWKKEYKKYINKNYEYFNEHLKAFKKNSLVNRAQLFDLTNYLPFDILTKVDVASMMNSLETRVPFIDREVIEIALSMPEGLNYKENAKWEGKYLLKKNLENDFSHDFVYRQKQGFGVPLIEWYAEDGSLYNEPYIRLMNPKSEIFRELFNPEFVYQRITCGEHNKTYLLLFLEEWLYQFENKEGRLKI
jgi:asparagine synthase (glutamine-hydrolysing)